MAEMTLLSTADFNAAVWTNKQHLAVRLSEHLPVTYIESLGLRTPTLNGSDIRRIISRISKRGHFTTDGRNDFEKLTVVKPRAIPLHANRIIAQINTRNLKRQFRRTQQDSRRILWTFSPLTYGIEDDHDYTVYHSVDLLHELPGIPRDTLLRAEALLVKRADAVIASSSGVRDHLLRLGAPAVSLWENVADTDLYARTETARKPRVVFAGNLTRSKIDFNLMHAVADTGLPFILAGPRGIDGSGDAAAIDSLLDRSNVEYRGNLAPRELAELLASCTVGLIPYALNRYTAGVFPMKVYEYLAAGLAVVTTPLPSLTSRDERLPEVIIEPQENFAKAVENNAEVSAENIQRRRKVAESHSWNHRTEQALRLIGLS